jgi:signal peptidase II
MQKKWLFFITVVTIWLLDQATKLLVNKYIPPYTKTIKITPFLNLVHIRNTGIAFGLWAGGNGGKQIFFIVFSLVAIVFIFYYFWRTLPSFLNNLACGLVLGGALGNLTDRLLYGNVIDFIDCHWRHYHWPAFNVADSAVTIGMFLLALKILKEQN